MRAVKAAEARLLKEQDSKAYVGVLGDLGFVDALADLALGSAVPRDRLAGAQTPGGTGAIRQLFELVRRAAPGATVWHSDPTWPNHPAILGYLGIPARTYRYFDAATRGVDFAAHDGRPRGDEARRRAASCTAAATTRPAPTSASTQWREVTEFVLASRVVPLIDLAYQGFGDGLEPDAAGLRHMAAAVPELMLAVSCSKNFGLYRDRVGAAFVLSADKAANEVTRANLSSLNRLNFSFPPDHGAKVVAIILGDPELKADWMAELEDMRLGMLDLRRGLAEALRRETNSDRFDFVAKHRGMFSPPRRQPRAGRGAARGARHLHGRRQPGEHRRPAGGRPRQARPGAGGRRRLMAPVPFITAEDVEGRLDWLAIAEALADGHRRPRAAIGDVFVAREPDTLLTRAAWIDGLGAAVKAVTVMPGNAARGLASVQGALLVFDDATGGLEAVIDFGLVTRWKTAANSLLGARLLARPDSRRLLVLGAGAVAASLIEAYRAGFPGIAVSLWNRSPDRARALAEATGAELATDLPAAVAAADIVATATMATEPVLLGALAAARAAPRPGRRLPRRHARGRRRRAPPRPHLRRQLRDHARAHRRAQGPAGARRHRPRRRARRPPRPRRRPRRAAERRGDHAVQERRRRASRPDDGPGDPRGLEPIRRRSIDGELKHPLLADRCLPALEAFSAPVRGAPNAFRVRRRCAATGLSVRR